MTREKLVEKMQAVAAKGEKNGWTEELRAQFDRLHAAIKGMDAQSSGPDTRGVNTSGKSKPKDKATGFRYNDSDSIEGRPNEELSQRQSMREWVKRASQNGVTVQRDDGMPVRVEYRDEEYLNEFFGQMFGLSRKQSPAITRALGEDTGSGPGAAQAIVPQFWTAWFIDALYPLTVLGKVGATRVPMGTELVNVPQLAATPAPVWAGENTATSLDATPAFSTIQLNAKGAFYDIALYSMELAMDAYINGGLPGVLAQSLAKKYAIALDQAWLYGVAGNAGNPGMSNEVGIILRKWAGHSGTTGQAPVDTQELSVLIEIVRNVNAEPNGFVTSPQLVGTLNRLNASTYARFWRAPVDASNLWDNVAYSTTIPVTETDPASGVPAQTAGTMTSLYCGDFTRVLMGIRLDMATQVLKERYIDQKQFGMFSWLRASLRTSHPEAFVRSYGALTT